MINHRLISQIMYGIWLMDANAAHSYLPVVANLLDGKSVEQIKDNAELRMEHRPYWIDAADIRTASPGTYSGFKNAGPESVAVIPVVGPVMKYDEECGPVGSSTITNWVKQANASENIDSIILKIDSPGGMVDGTQTLAQAIRDSKKPVIAFVDDGIMASAAYWIGSGAAKIIASQKTDVIGSIGVMMAFADVQPYFEKLGVKFHEIYADQSPDKNKDFREALKGNYVPLRKGSLNPIAKEFISEISANRKGKIDLEQEDVTTGKTYSAVTAVKNGLIDDIGTYEDALGLAADMAKSNRTTTVAFSTSNNSIANNQKPKPMKINLSARLTGLLAFFGAKVESGAESTEVDITAEQLTELNATVTKLASVEAELTTAKADLKTATTAAAEKDVRIVELEAEVTRLGALTGAARTKTIKNGTDEIDETGEETQTTENKALAASVAYGKESLGN